MNSFFRISEWYALLKKMIYPLHISPDNILEEKDENMEFLTRIRDVDLVRQSIRINIQTKSLSSLEEVLPILGCSSLYGKVRDMALVSFLQEKGTALYTYNEDRTGMISATKDMNAMDVIKIKKPVLYNGNFDLLFSIVGNEIASSVEMEDDSILIADHQKRCTQLRNEVAKKLYVDFMKREITLQIQRLRQVGAIR